MSFYHFVIGKPFIDERNSSVYPFHSTHALFRIELEYGDSLLKWVIYREMRDFVNLHTHYKLYNVISQNTNIKNLPTFPTKQSLPYL